MKQLAWKTEIRSGKVFVEKTDVLKQLKLSLNNDKLFNIIKELTKEAISKTELDMTVGMMLMALYRGKQMLLTNSLDEYYAQGIDFDYTQYFKTETKKIQERKKK